MAAAALRVINRVFPAPSASSFQLPQFSNQRGIIQKFDILGGEGGNESQIQRTLPASVFDFRLIASFC